MPGVMDQMEIAGCLFTNMLGAENKHIPAAGPAGAHLKKRDSRHNQFGAAVKQRLTNVLKLPDNFGETGSAKVCNSDLNVRDQHVDAKCEHGGTRHRELNT